MSIFIYAFSNTNKTLTLYLSSSQQVQDISNLWSISVNDCWGTTTQWGGSSQGAPGNVFSLIARTFCRRTCCFRARVDLVLAELQVVVLEVLVLPSLVWVDLQEVLVGPPAVWCEYLSLKFLLIMLSSFSGHRELTLVLLPWEEVPLLAMAAELRTNSKSVHECVSERVVGVTMCHICL